MIPRLAFQKVNSIRWTTEDQLFSIIHCGHATANFPYYIDHPDSPLVIAPFCKCFTHLEDAKGAVDLLAYGELEIIELLSDRFPILHCVTVKGTGSRRYHDNQKTSRMIGEHLRSHGVKGYRGRRMFSGFVAGLK